MQEDIDMKWRQPVGMVEAEVLEEYEVEEWDQGLKRSRSTRSV